MSVEYFNILEEMVFEEKKLVCLLINVSLIYFNLVNYFQGYPLYAWS